jgi:hypothetical protein
VIRFFSSSHPVNILLLFFLGLIIRVPFFISPPAAAHDVTSGELYVFFYKHVFVNMNAYPILLPLVAYIVIFIQGLSVNGFINNQKLFPTPHLLFVLSYIIFTALSPAWNTLSPQLLVSIIIAFIIQRILFVYQKANAANDLFILSLISGIGSLIYKPAFLLLFMLLAGVLIFRPFRLSDWIIVVFGFLLPYYLGFSFLYISDHWDLAKNLIPYFSIQKPFLFRKSEEMVAAVLLLLPLIVGFFYSWRQAVRMVVLPRKGWTFITFSLLICILFIFSGVFYNFDALFLILIPASFFITSFLYFPQVKFFPSLYVWLVLSFLMVSYFI